MVGLFFISFSDYLLLYRELCRTYINVDFKMKKRLSRIRNDNAHLKLEKRSGGETRRGLPGGMESQRARVRPVNFSVGL